MSDDQPTVCCGKSCEGVAMKARTYSSSVPGERHTATTETDSQWLPKQKSSQSRGNLRLPSSLRGSSSATVLRTKLSRWSLQCLSQGQHSWVSLPETAFAGLVREGRGEVRVCTLTAEEKREPVRAKQSEIGSFMKDAAVQVATRSSVRPTAPIRMRWVITRIPDSSLKARFGRLVIHRSAVWRRMQHARGEKKQRKT